MAITALQYHDATKHHFQRYARSAGYMDWANQPNPFRGWQGAAQHPLPMADDPSQPTLDRLFAPADDDIAAAPLSAATLGRFLGLSLGLSAWKAAGGSRWSLRINPSSGNLHPTECHLILPAAAEDLPGGVCHYHPFFHALEQRAPLPEGAWPLWEAHFGGAGFAVALTTICWRESWKYGERALRYCLLDGGHALAAIGLAARLNGWRLTCLAATGDRRIETLLGWDRIAWPDGEQEHVELLCWVATGQTAIPAPRTLPETLVQPFAQLQFQGRPSRLSARAAHWPIIEQAVAATRKAPTAAPDDQLPVLPLRFPPPAAAAAALMRRRRSAVAFDPHGRISADTFYAILDRTLPRKGVPPFDAGLMAPVVDLLLFVHRVDDLPPGLYWFQRSADRPVFGSDLVAEPVQSDWPLWRLRTGNVQYEAMELSCHQEIAGRSAFAVAMPAPLRPLVARQPYLYRHLHWECGMIGQVLYLAAEAHGLRGTGIGCFFDEPVQTLLGIDDDRLQSLYHFTIGHPVEDTRIATLPPYDHLSRPTDTGASRG